MGSMLTTHNNNNNNKTNDNDDTTSGNNDDNEKTCTRIGATTTSSSADTTGSTVDVVGNAVGIVESNVTGSTPAGSLTTSTTGTISSRTECMHPSYSSASTVINDDKQQVEEEDVLVNDTTIHSLDINTAIPTNDGKQQEQLMVTKSSLSTHENILPCNIVDENNNAEEEELPVPSTLCNVIDLIVDDDDENENENDEKNDFNKNNKRRKQQQVSSTTKHVTFEQSYIESKTTTYKRNHASKSSITPSNTSTSSNAAEAGAGAGAVAATASPKTETETSVSSSKFKLIPSALRRQLLRESNNSNSILVTCTKSTSSLQRKKDQLNGVHQLSYEERAQQKLNDKRHCLLFSSSSSLSSSLQKKESSSAVSAAATAVSLISPKTTKPTMVTTITPTAAKIRYLKFNTNENNNMKRKRLNYVIEASHSAKMSSSILQNKQCNDNDYHNADENENYMFHHQVTRCVTNDDDNTNKNNCSNTSIHRDPEREREREQEQEQEQNQKRRLSIGDQLLLLTQSPSKRKKKKKAIPSTMTNASTSTALSITEKLQTQQQDTLENKNNKHGLENKKRQRLVPKNDELLNINDDTTMETKEEKILLRTERSIKFHKDINGCSHVIVNTDINEHEEISNNRKEKVFVTPDICRKKHSCQKLPNDDDVDDAADYNNNTTTTTIATLSSNKNRKKKCLLENYNDNEKKDELCPTVHAQNSSTSRPAKVDSMKVFLQNELKMYSNIIVNNEQKCANDSSHNVVVPLQATKEKEGLAIPRDTPVSSDEFLLRNDTNEENNNTICQASCSLIEQPHMHRKQRRRAIAEDDDDDNDGADEREYNLDSIRESLVIDLCDDDTEEENNNAEHALDISLQNRNKKQDEHQEEMIANEVSTILVDTMLAMSSALQRRTQQHAYMKTPYSYISCHPTLVTLSRKRPSSGERHRKCCTYCCCLVDEKLSTGNEKSNGNVLRNNDRSKFILCNCQHATSSSESGCAVTFSFYNTLHAAVLSEFKSMSAVGKHEYLNAEIDKLVGEALSDDPSERSSLLYELWCESFPLKDYVVTNSIIEEGHTQWTSYTSDSVTVIESSIARLQAHRRKGCAHKCNENNGTTEDNYLTLPGSSDYNWWMNNYKELERHRTEQEKILQTMATRKIGANEMELSTTLELQSTNNDTQTLASGGAIAQKLDDSHKRRHYRRVLSKVPSPAQLVRLRRMLLPMFGQVMEIDECSDVPPVTVKQGSKAFLSDKDKSHHSRREICIGWYSLNKSLFDLWISHPSSKEKAIETLLSICSIIPHYFGHERNIINPMLAFHDQIFNTAARYQYQEMQSLIVKALQSASSTYPFQIRTIELNQSLKIHDISTGRFDPRLQSFGQDSFADHVMTKRSSEVSRYEHGREVSDTLLAGNIIYSCEDGWKEDDFLREAYRMLVVNKSFPSYFIPTISRPKLARLSVFDNNLDDLNELQSIFFNESGCFRSDASKNVEVASKHFFITFSDDIVGAYTDKRWQIPIRRSKSATSTWMRVKEILERVKILHSDEEELVDLAILVGGTRDQKLHHDTSRQWACWQSQHHQDQDDDDSSMAERKIELGWEANRLIYNRDMADAFAPASYLIGMGGDKHKVLLGIQRDQIEMLNLNAMTCRIKNGLPNDTYRIVRMSDDLVVVEFIHGCCFTGDFPHAGVQNVHKSSSDMKLLMNLFRQMDEIVDEFEDDHELRSLSVLQLFHSYKNLDRLCRLHFSTKRRNTRMVVPSNAIGYEGCVSNTI